MPDAGVSRLTAMGQSPRVTLSWRFAKAQNAQCPMPKVQSLTPGSRGSWEVRWKLGAVALQGNLRAQSGLS